MSAPHSSSNGSSSSAAASTTSSAPAPAPAPAVASSKSRPVPGGIRLPAVKKRRVASGAADADSEAVGTGEDDAGVAQEEDGGGDDDDEEENGGGGVGDGVSPDVLSSHNTPSASFFAAALQPRVEGRVTHNPAAPLPPFLTRVRHAKQLVLVSTNPKHNVKPFKVGKDMDEVRHNDGCKRIGTIRLRTIARCFRMTWIGSSNSLARLSSLLTIRMTILPWAALAAAAGCCCSLASRLS